MDGGICIVNWKEWFQEQILNIRYHLVKEKGMTLTGARQRLKDNKEATIRNYEIVNRLKAIKDELLAIKQELDGR